MSVPEPDLARWIRTFRGPLIGLLVSRGARWRQAEELAQDAFAEAWLSWSRFQGVRSDLRAVGAWLRGIAYRLHGAAARRERRRASQPLDALELAAPAAGPDPRREVLDAAIDRLPVAQQTVVRMRYLEDSAPGDVAALLGITPKAVERRLYQARKSMRDHLARDERAAGATR